MELIDWRNQLLPDSRQRIVGKIMDTLKRHLPFSGQEGYLELKKIAVRFEEKTYMAAVSQPDYLRRISLKMLSMETKSQNNNISNSMATNSGGNGKNTTESGSQCMQSQVNNQGQPISMPVMNSQSQSRQQLLSQSLQNSITSTAMQSSVGLSSALPSVCTQTNLVGQNSGFGDFFPTQNISGISQNSLGNSAQGLPSSMFSGAHKQMQGRQVMQQQIMPQQPSQSQNSQQQFFYQQQLQHQLMRQKLQQGNVSHALIHSHLQNQQQQQSLLQSNPQSLMQPSVIQSTLQNQSSSVQHSAQSVIQQHQQSVVRQNQQVQQSPIVHQQQISMSQSQQQQINGQQLVGQQTNSSNMQQNQLSGQQNISEMQLQRSTGQQNNVLSLQQHPQAANSQNSFSNHSQMGSQTSISGLQQQQQQLGAVQPLNSIQSNTHSEHVMPQSKVQQQTQSSTSLSTQGQQSQVQQQLMSQMQAQVQPLQQQLSLQQQPNLMQRDMQQRLNSGNMLQPQSITEQQKQMLQSQRILQDTSTSLDSTIQSGQVIGGEWQEELYQKIKVMKEMYLTELLEMYQKTSSRLHQPKPPQLEKYKVFRSMLEHLLLFLQLPKNGITLAHKEKLPLYEKQILGFLNTNKRKLALHSNPMHLQPSDSQMLAPHGQPTTSTAMNTLPLQSTSLPLQSNPNLLQQQDQMLQPQQQLKQQLQHRQMHHQLMQKQLLQQQRKQAQPMLLHQQQQQMPQFHQITDMNDLKPRQQPGIGMKPGIFQQQPMGGQRSFIQQQSLKPGSSFPLQSAQILPSHHLSPQVDQQSLSFSKTGTPLQGSGTGSPFVVPSPSTPLAPSPIPGDSEKPHSGISSAISNPGNASNQLTAAGAPAPSLAIGTPGISASPLLAEFTAQDTTHGNTSMAAKPGLNEQPLDRIIKAVKSMSTKALSGSVSDMSSVISMVDAIAGSAPGNGSRAAVGDDLVAMTRCRVQARASAASQDSNVGAKKMRRHMNVMPLSTSSYSAGVNDIVMQFGGPDAADFESTATSIAKNPKMESLMEEIQGINDRLIDTLIDIGDGEEGDAGEGIVVKCSFTATALCPSLKEEYTSGKMSNIKPISLLVPSDYPNSSPMLLLEKAAAAAAMVDETSEEGEEDISAKVRSRFGVSLRSLSQPMSLWKMAKAWDICVRSAILEYVQLRGGGTFTSKYGAWENNEMH